MYRIARKIHRIVSYLVFLQVTLWILGGLAFSALPFDFAHPTASMNREATWPVIEPYGPGYTQTWRALYDRFGLDFEASLDLSHPDEHWRRYLYFNAGWFTGPCPRRLGARRPPLKLRCRMTYCRAKGQSLRSDTAEGLYAMSQPSSLPQGHAAVL